MTDDLPPLSEEFLMEHFVIYWNPSDVPSGYVVRHKFGHEDFNSATSAVAFVSTFLGVES